MLQQSKKIGLTKEDCENLLVEKWMQRNSKNNFTILQTYIKPDSKNVHQIPSFSAESNDFKSIKQIDLPKSSSKIRRFSNEEISKPASFKRSYNIISTKDEDPVKLKVVKQTKTITVIKSEPLNKNIPTKIEHDESSTEPSNHSTLKNQKVTRVGSNVISSNLSDKVKSNETKSVSTLNALVTFSKPDIQKADSQLCNKNNVKVPVCVKNNLNIYSNLLQNYKHLKSPKSWTATQLIDSIYGEYVIFFCTSLIKGLNTPVPFMKKSLTINKKCEINYAVHGLPINTYDTILPDTLDDIKKLLSVLHLFDKMQVCDGVGTNLEVHQNNCIIKDNCGYWRHKNCKIISVKVPQCSVCALGKIMLFE